MKKRINKFKYVYFIFICLSLIVPVHAIEINQNSPASIIRPYTFGFGTKNDADEGVSKLIEAADFKHLTFVDSTGYSIKYWVHIPKDTDGQPIENLPLVMYMHGYSDGGDNNIAIRYHNAVVFRLIQQQNVSNRQAIILVPQTPNSENSAGESDYFKDQWVGIRGNNKWSQWNKKEWSMDDTPRTKNLNAVIELVKNVQKETKSDVNRAYVTGISMGGYATWDLISRDNEDLFAAAVPICGVGDPNKIENVKNIPIRIYHGSLDSTINPISSQKMYLALRKYGNVSYTEYKKENHASWNAAYSPILDDNGDGKNNLDDLIDWMFNQSRNGTLDGKVDKGPLNSVIWDARQEKEENYSSAKWQKLQETIISANSLINKECDEKEIKDIIGLLDTMMADKDKNKADMTNLLEKIEEGDKLEKEKYTAASWSEFQYALTNAKEIVKNIDASQEDIDKALVRLQTTIDSLVLISEETTNKTTLAIAIEVANAVTETDLEKIVPAVVEEFNAALANAKAVYASISATQDEVDNAFNRLANVMQMLEFYKGDKDLLQKLVDQINGLIEEEYIPSTWNAMLPSLDKANDVLANVNAMQEEVDEVYSGLIKSFIDLRLKPNKDLLQELINKANGLNEANYTAKSWQVVSNALEDAMEVYVNTDVTKAEVEAAQARLGSAIEELAAVTEVPVKPAAPGTSDNTVNPSVTDSVVKAGDKTASVKTGDTTSSLYPITGLVLAGLIVYGNKKRKTN